MQKSQNMNGTNQKRTEKHKIQLLFWKKSVWQIFNKGNVYKCLKIPG